MTDGIKVVKYACIDQVVLTLSNMKQVIEDVIDILPDCYEEGTRDESRPRCMKNFPKVVSIELAAHLEKGLLVEGRNPATYQAQTIFSCTHLTEFLVQHLVGCNAHDSLGVTSPMSATFWCQQLDYRPYRDEYHPIASALPGGGRRITQERRYVRPLHPNDRGK